VGCNRSRIHGRVIRSQPSRALQVPQSWFPALARVRRRCWDPQSASPPGRSASVTIGPGKSAAGNPRRTHSLRSRAGAVGVRPVYQTLEWRPRHRGWSRTLSNGIQVCGPQRTAGLTRAVRGSQSTGLRHSQVAPSNPCTGRNYNGKFSCAVDPEASIQPRVLSGYLHVPSLP